MKIGKYFIKAKLDRWPWQDGYGWGNMTGRTAPLNPKGARFGGGWKYKLGISIGGSTILLDLFFGMVQITWGNWREKERRDAEMKERLDRFARESKEREQRDRANKVPF